MLSGLGRNAIRLSSYRCFKSSSKVLNLTNERKFDRPSIGELVGPGEWIVDYMPDVKFMLGNKENLVSSLVKRIYSHSEDQAQQLVQTLQDHYDNYEQYVKAYSDLSDRLTEVRMNNKKGIHVPKLEYAELKQALSQAKDVMFSSESALKNLCSTFPNFLIDLSLPQDLKEIEVAPRKPKSISSNHFPLCSSYQDNYHVGKHAEFSLKATNEICDYLNNQGFVEVTVPSMVRYDVLEKLGMVVNEEDGYILQTKSELHSEAGDEETYRDATEDRKAKPEDQYVYKCSGLNDINMALLFLRQQTNIIGDPINLFSIGSKYRYPDVGKPCQSKVVSCLSASSCEDFDATLLINFIYTARELLRLFGVESRLKLVEPHLLFQHEAVAVELFAHDCLDGRVLSRLSFSSDFLSRRIMSYKSLKKDTFLHFTSGTLLDMTELSEYLHSKS